MAVLDLGPVVGPRGPQGEQGGTGPQGPQGIQGPEGEAATVNGRNALTITGGSNIELTQDGDDLRIDAHVPGRNLLLNWDFRNPVNRNGQTEYQIDARTYSIDRWFGTNITLSVEENHCHVSAKRIAAYKRITQLTDQRMKAGSTYTLSMLASVSALSGTVHLRGCSSSLGTVSGFSMKQLSITSGYELFTTTLSPTTDISDFGVEILAQNTADDYFDISIQGWKLEPGLTQTLAKQNAAGEWELIDPPDYAQQYALCEQYSPITGEWVGSQHSNTNLLDNSRWDRKENIINQKGQEEYIGTGYGIDRWCSNKSETTVSMGDVGLTVKPGATTGGTWVFYQKIENARSFVGKTLTVSALIAEAVGSAATLIISARNSNDEEINYKSIVISPGLVSATHNLIPDNTVHLRVGIYVRSGADANDYIKLLAAKLERGPIQTLAHKEGDEWVLNDPPPDKALELLKCQKYQLVINGGNNAYMPNLSGFISSSSDEISCGLSIPVPFYKTPTVISENVGIIVRTATGYSTLSPSAHDTATPRGVMIYCIDKTNYLSLNFQAPSQGDKWGDNNTPCSVVFREGRILLDANL